jgi:tetratricopeptide (TPR) repeat protein
MHPSKNPDSPSISRAADWLLAAGVAAAAFLLGCYAMADSDVWWHLSGGRWILGHGRVPGPDPFTFGSADRKWVDVHWSFEVLVALAYAGGGVAALVLLAAAAGALAVLAAATARRRAWPAAVTAACWLGALVLVSWRFDPRPEILSLLYLAIFLAVLWRARERPALAWLLVPVQVLWANTQGLFVLGPVVTALFVAAAAAESGRSRVWDGRWWWHVGGAALAVAAACLVNPYFLDGARFPFDLYSKVAQEGNPYKEYIDELASPRKLVAGSAENLLANWYIRDLYFLLLTLPLSFLVPAAWRVWQAAPAPAERGRGATGRPPQAGAWTLAAVGAFALAALATAALPPRGIPGWLAALGPQTPLLCVLAGAAGAGALVRRSRRAAAIAVAGALALATWTGWLRAYLLADPGPAPPAPLLVAAGVLAAAALLLAGGADVFRLLLAGAFGFLALRAIQNDSRFALVAATVMAWNLGEWAAEVAPGLAPPWRVRLAWAGRAAVAVVLAGLMAAVVTDRYGRWTGEPRHFGLAEQPLEFAHEAVRFAGSSGLPEHALVYELGQTGLYDFYHGPDRKPYMDGRLEMPALSTFQTYVRIQDQLRDGDPHWEAELDRLGRPLLLLTHPQHVWGEADVLTQPGWRCIYFDALAGVYVAHGTADEAAFPAVDFAVRHFRAAAEPSVPPLPGAAFRELQALAGLGSRLRALSLQPDRADRHDAARSLRVPVLLCALDRGELALAEDPARRPAAWRLLGDSHRGLAPERTAGPPGPALPWDPAVGLPYAQATYCYRRAGELAPDEPAALHALLDIFAARRMFDAQLRVGAQLQQLQALPAAQARQLDQLRRGLGPPLSGPGGGDVSEVLDALLQAGRPESAVRLLEKADASGAVTWTWPVAERAASAYLHLGRPDAARRAWQRAVSAPSEALRRCRLAETHWVERDFDAAARLYREARALDPRLGDTCWGLAVLAAQRGDAPTALEACRAGVKLSPTGPQRAELQTLEPIVARHARP